MNTTTNPALSDLKYLADADVPWSPTPALAAAMAALTHHDDEFVLAADRTLRLRVMPDDAVSINDYDCYGRIEWKRDGYNGAVRPDGFTGRARIMDRNHGSTLWWEPYEGQTEDETREEEPMIRRLIEEGFCVVGLELRETVHDSLGHEHTVVLDTAWLGGVDQMYADVIGQLVADLTDQVGD